MQLGALDHKTPLVRAEEKMGELFVRLSRFLGKKETLNSSFEIFEPFLPHPNFEERILNLDSRFTIDRKKQGSFPHFAISSSKKGSSAVEGNALIIEIIQQMGVSSHLHGKRIDWSFSLKKQDEMCRLILMAAMTHAIYEHGPILAASSGSLQKEAPALGIVLEREGEKILLGEELVRDERAPPFCTFTANGFSFHGLEPLSDLSFSLCTILAAFADSLQLILDELFDAKEASIFTVLRKRANEARSATVLQKCPLYHLEPSAAIKFLEPKSIRCFEKILDEQELFLRKEALLSHYNHHMQTEIKAMSDLFRKETLPKILMIYKKREIKMPHELSSSIEKAILLMDGLDTLQEQIQGFGLEARAKVLFEVAAPKILETREIISQLETF